MQGLEDDLFENLPPLQAVGEHPPQLQPADDSKPGTPTPKRRKKEKNFRQDWDTRPESLKDWRMEKDPDGQWIRCLHGKCAAKPCLLTLKDQFQFRYVRLQSHINAAHVAPTPTKASYFLSALGFRILEACDHQEI